MKLNDILNNLKLTGYITICDPNSNIKDLSDISDSDSYVNNILNKLKDAGYITILDPNDNIEDLADVTDITSTLSINPTPADATVIINGEERTSITEVVGAIIEWTVEKAGYISQSSLYTMGQDNYTLDITLEVAGHNFTIIPNPSDAVVTINGEVRNSILAPVGTLISWSVDKDGYRPKSGTYTMGNEDHTENVTLNTAHYLVFKVRSNGTIGWKANKGYVNTPLEYSINNGVWTEIRSTYQGASFNVSTGDVVRFRGENSDMAIGDQSIYNNFIGTANVYVSGYIDAIFQEGRTRCVMGLFKEHTSLDIDPDDTLHLFELNDQQIVPVNYCYKEMFYGCTSLTKTPTLPTTTLMRNCYDSMFYGCTSLTTAPALPATAIQLYCYSKMFMGCTNLTTAPELPATTLAQGCYQQMFYNCSKIDYIKCLAQTTSANDYTKNWLYGASSTGTFIKDPNTTWPTGASGIPTEWTINPNE